MNGMNEHEQGNYFPCDRTRKTFRYRIFEVEKYPRMVIESPGTRNTRKLNTGHWSVGTIFQIPVSGFQLSRAGRVVKLADTQRSGRCGRKVVRVQVPPRPQEWNLAVENQPRSGRAVGTPTLFRLIFQTNSDSRLRRCEGFFRQETGASQRFLWHRPFLQKGLNQKQFCPRITRLLASFGKVRANHSACVKK